jgi:hypothetical protein
MFIFSIYRIAKKLVNVNLQKLFKMPSMFSNFPVEYTIRNLQENQAGVKHQLLAYADNVNLLEDNTGTTLKEKT